MQLYGLADYFLLQIVDFYLTQAEAEEALQQVLADEPEWEGMMGVEVVTLADGLPSWN